MGRTTTITCDGCGRNLSEPINHREQMLVLSGEGRPTIVGGLVYDMYKEPMIKTDHYYCHFDCLRSWLRVLEGNENRDE